MSNHLKRVAAPASWPILKRTTKYVAKVSPGPQGMNYALPMSLVLKITGHARTTFESKRILLNNNVLVDGRRVKSTAFPVGIMDVITLPTNEQYRMLINTKGKLCMVPITKAETTFKPCRITNKKTVRKGKIQLNLTSGRNVLVEKNEHKPGDTIILTIPKQQIKQHLKLEKNNYALIVAGKHAGTHGRIKNVTDELVTLEHDKKTVQTASEYAIVIGKEKPIIKLP